MKSIKPPKVVESSNLNQYKLNKDLLGKLRRFDEMVDWMKKGGKNPPTAVRLSHNDWLDINNAVVEQSRNKYDASTVFWRGYPLIDEYERMPEFRLSA